jgi:trk system potassium uptake protein TrkH
MQVRYRNRLLERIVVTANALVAVAVVASFVMLFGFERPLVAATVLYGLQIVLLCALVAEKVIRAFNAFSALEYLRANWIEVPALAVLGAVLFFMPGIGGQGAWAETTAVRHLAVGIYLVLQVIIKVCRAVINLAASGRSPTEVLIASFLVLIVSGAGALCLPRCSSGDRISFLDALFTSTSATCVTGLIVRDTGRDFSLMGQVIILGLIQLGGLGIVVFGAVFALLLGQALSLRESVAMQDLLSARTLGRIGAMIAFIFVATVLVEALGALSLFRMWDDVPGRVENLQQQWFCSVFHSISAFCNAGFSLFDDSFVGYRGCWGVYAVVCPLIILGGLGFGVLYDLTTIAANRVKVFFSSRLSSRYRLTIETPALRRMELQTKIVLAVSAFLLVSGWLGVYVLERFAVLETGAAGGLPGAFFTSVTARTAGFNTVDVHAMSGAGRMLVILLMFIGGSPGSTAGGIKTVTMAVLAMTVVAALRKRQEVEMFGRSVHVVVVGRALTVTLLFVVVLFSGVLALSATERAGGFTLSQIMFETASALGTVGLTTGITGSLTSTGKLIIIAVMLIGRLGPLTLLALLTFNLKPVRYNYPQEAVIVG